MERTELSEHIRILREDYLHETQSQFAERLGLSRIAVARYEAGRVPKRAVLRVLREIAADVDYRSGSVVFSRASGQQPPPAEPENSLLELMDTATRLAGNWSLVKAYVDMEEE